MNMFMRQPPPPKGDINKLWHLLGVNFDDQHIIWQNYNPYPKASQFPREFVFVDEGCGAKEPFNPKDAISSGLQQVLFLFPGAVAKLNTSDLTFDPLVTTGEKTGTVLYRDILEMSPFGPRGLNPDRRQKPTNQAYVMAAHIEGKVKVAPQADEEKKEEAGKKENAKSEEKKPRESSINVVLVADVDMLSPEFFRLREQGNNPEAGIHFDFDNVTFVLNALDELAGGEQSNDFIAIRKRRPTHRTLTRIEQRTEKAKQEAVDAREKYTKQYDDLEKQEQKAFDDKIAELQRRKNVDIGQMAIELSMMKEDLDRRRSAKLERARANGTPRSTGARPN